MPLLGNGEFREPIPKAVSADPVDDIPRKTPPIRRQSQISGMAKTAIMSHFSTPNTEGNQTPDDEDAKANKINGPIHPNDSLAVAQHCEKHHPPVEGKTLSDTPLTTPATTAPNSPIMYE